MKVFATILIIFFCIQNLFAQNTTPPDMPIPAEFAQPAPPPGGHNQAPPSGAAQPQNQPQPQPPPQTQTQAPPPAQPQNTPNSAPPTPQPVDLNTVNSPQAAPGKTRLPDDFELIGIKPYFKNKPRIGHLTVTLLSSQNETLATVAGDFGDCKNCLRGASVKGKIGIRLYGNTMKDLTVSRKQSFSIKLENCSGNQTALANNLYSCEFSHKDVKMKMTLKIDP